MSVADLLGDVQAGIMAVVGGSLGLVVVALWPSVGRYLHRLGRIIGWVCPYTARAAWLSLKWLCWATWLFLSWLFWLMHLVMRLFWGAE